MQLLHLFTWSFFSLFSLNKIGSIKSGFVVIEHGILYFIVAIFYSSKGIRNTNNKFLKKKSLNRPKEGGGNNKEKFIQS